MLLYMQKNDTDPKFCAGAVELYLWTIFRSYGVIDTTHRNETQVIPQVIRYITEHFSEPLTLEDIAAEFFVSKSYLNRHFKAYTNSTVYAYIMALRLTHARRMLREGIPAVEAGRECGFFRIIPQFYKAFKTKPAFHPSSLKAGLDFWKKCVCSTRFRSRRQNIGRAADVFLKFPDKHLQPKSNLL